MAQKVQILITCDMDEGDVPAESTVKFGYDGKSYVFELCEKHLKAYEKAIKPFVEAARLDAPVRRVARARRSASTSSEDLTAIRIWAKENAYRVSSRGRISQEVKDAYYAAAS